MKKGNCLHCNSEKVLKQTTKDQKEGLCEDCYHLSKSGITLRCEFCKKDILYKLSRGFTPRFCNHNCARKQWRKNNPEKDKAQAKRDRLAVKNDKRRWSNLLRWNREYAKRPEVAFKKCKNGAKNRNLSFSLTKKQFLSFHNSHCHYCNDHLDRIGLDRVDNNKGYSIDNVVPCCPLCNNMKKVLTKNQFIKQCAKITAHNGSA